MAGFHQRMCSCATLAMVLLIAMSATAADETFVGVLSVVVDDDVVKKLEIEETTLKKLNALIAEREDEALELALKIDDLPKEEQKARLAPFVAESERRGLALLSEAQRKRLEQVLVAREGMRGLADEKIAKSLKLSPEQIASVKKLIEQRAKELVGSNGDKRRAIEALYERKLAAVLEPAQRSAWERLAGLAAGDQPMLDPARSDTGTRKTDVAKGDTAKPGVPAKPVVAGDGKLKFNFRFAPWKDVLDWFAEQADLSLVLDAPPTGTFNYRDTREYTPAEAIDLLNGVLLTKGYTLVRRDRMLMLVNLEDGVPPNLVPRVSIDKLDEKGEFELVSCLFQLEKMTANEAEEEIRKLIGPQGSIVVLPKARQLFVTETAGKLRTVRSVLEAIERPKSAAGGRLSIFPIKNVDAEDVLNVVRPMLGLPDDQNTSSDGSIRIATDPLGTRLIVSAKPEQVKRVEEIIEIVDVPLGLDPDGAKVVATPQLEVYPITEAEPETVLKVLQTLLAGQPDVRLATDAATGHLVAMARPAQHATIRATIDQMQQDGRQIDVVQLRRIDPQVAVLSINKLFGVTGKETSKSRVPQVDADPITRQLLIRATASQIKQIRELLTKMGETDQDVAAGAGAQSERGNVRQLPITGHAARTALEQIERIWPTSHRNKIRIVRPSAAVRTMRPRSETPTKESSEEKPTPKVPMKETKPKTPPAADEPGKGVSDPTECGADEEPEEKTAEVKGDAADGDDMRDDESKPAAEIVVAPGPNGVVIASEDLEALDKFEKLFTSLAESALASGSRYTIFYLKYAKADAAAELLTDIMGGSNSGESDGGSLLGDIAGAAFGGGGSGMIGTLLGLGGSGGGSGPALAGATSIVADTRLNALVVQGPPDELDAIEELLKIIDQQASPEDVQTVAPPRLIAVYNTGAEEIADVVRQVYADRLRAAPGRQRQPTPEEFVRALRGDRGRSSKSKRTEEPKMSIGVDTRSNSLIVSADDRLFKQVEALVRQLDRAGNESNQTVEVVAIRRVNPDLVQKALSSIVGDQIRTSKSSSKTKTKASSSTSGDRSRTAPPSDDVQQQIRQRIEFFNALQRAGQSRTSPDRGRPQPNDGGRPRGTDSAPRSR